MCIDMMVASTIHHGSCELGSTLTIAGRAARPEWALNLPLLSQS